jgi:hypothetical protein
MEANQGLFYIVLATMDKKGVKEYLWEEVDQQVYEARFKIFESVPAPRYIPYAAFREECKREMEATFAGLLDQAKFYLTSAQQRIGRLIAVEEQQRNAEHFDNETLKSLQKAFVRSGLLGAKLKFAGEKPVSLVVDWAQCLP